MEKPPRRARGLIDCKIVARSAPAGLVPVAAAAAVASATATTAATVAAASPTAAAATVAAASAAAATAPVFLGAGFVDGECPAVVLLTVQCRDRRGRLVVRAHLDKAEALAAAGVAIVDNLGAGHLTVLPKQLFEIRAGHVVAQIPHVKLLTHLESPVNG